MLISIESKTITDEEIIKKHNIKKKVGYLKMKVIDSLKKKDIAGYTKELIDTGTDIVTDGSNSYNDLHENYNHKPKVVSKKELVKHLPWVHIVISNSKRLLLNTYHRIDDDSLQSYLNEFCFKFNRRYFDDLFDRLLITSASYRWNYLGG